MADLPFQDAHDPPHVFGDEGGEIDGGIEAAATEGAVEIVGGAIAAQALDAGAEGIGMGPPVEERDLVPGGQQAPDEVVADEARSADDEDLQDADSAAARKAGGT
jgi:hypothetical protein